MECDVKLHRSLSLKLKKTSISKRGQNRARNWLMAKDTDLVQKDIYHTEENVTSIDPQGSVLGLVLIF